MTTDVPRLGIDIGSTTIKAVLLDGDDIVFEDYRRHNADIQYELGDLLDQIAELDPDRAVRASVTGSGGLGVSHLLGIPFVQEVIAETAAIQRVDPEADVIIELGGEDAKITYLKPVPEQRMNGTCAGGTGAFLDQMATLLRTDAAGLDRLAESYTTLYPIASRCGVFAKSDLQPLINDGAASKDLAASVFQAVATQTIAGLACGRPIRGKVVFLGGPLHFLPQLREAFRRALEGQVSEFSTPERAQLFVALGAAFLTEEDSVSVSVLQERARRPRSDGSQTPRMRPLFKDQTERREFDTRHAEHNIEQVDISEADGACFLGIDAGSTTIKAVVIDDQRRIVFSHYSSNQGDPVSAAVGIVKNIRRLLPRTAVIARSCVTGYGEGLIKAALHIDDGEVETMAHYRAAESVCPDVSSVIDIGGQDMKYLRIHDSVIDSISVNEACSSGCGSFLQSFAETMGLNLERFIDAALASFDPVDLGSRCTVFMNSSVKQAQKEGASVGDIAAGLSYSVVRNALYKVIKLRDSDQLGDKIVVQGGTFLNDAVLRAFELLTEREVIRPNIAGLMGAFGAAIIARSRFQPGKPGRLLSNASLNQLEVSTDTSVCNLCQNHCQCTISSFPDGERYVSGNRCERGADKTKAKSTVPNLYDYKYKRIFGYRRLTEAKAYRGDIGIPRVLNMYENYPFWFTVLTSLGFRVMISGRSSHELFEKGMDSIASENVCYPAKLVHGHIMQLLERGVETIFYPSVSYEQELVDGADNHFNCPVVTSYPQVIANNIDVLREDNVTFLNPFLNLANRQKLVDRIVEVFAEWNVTRDEAQSAVDAGFTEDEAVRNDIRQAGKEALEYIERTGTRGIVLAGRPYHIDPEVHHGIPELINGLGMAVLTEDAVSGMVELERPLRVRDQWSYHSRLYEAAAATVEMPSVELVQLNSFGCGLDAITADQVAEILHARGEVYTTLKIDEVSNLGAARIRLRSLQAASAERNPANIKAKASGSHALERVPFTEEMRAKHTIIAPQMSPIHFRILEAVMRRGGYRVEVLEHASGEDVELGLKHVNNDSCYPAIMVVGQLVNAFVEGKYDPDSTSVVITQTGGMCRATNYTGLLRKGLAEAGYPQIPVIAISTNGIEKNPGFSFTPKLAHHAMQAIVLGDLLQTLLLRVRPYATERDAANRLYERWNTICREFFVNRKKSQTWGGRLRYKRLVRHMVKEFNQLELNAERRRARVGIVGEILVKFHPDANNNVADVIESEGCEAVLPGLMEFVVNGMYAAEWNYANLGTDAKSRHFKRFARWFIERYQTPVRRALARTRGKFDVPGRMKTMIKNATTIASLGNQAGEGWLLTAEIVELIGEGVPNVVCVQPFACLPNHVTGKGMFREIRRQYPEANIVAVDYDPGASEVNQLNRIKLMIATAQMRHGGVQSQQPKREPEAVSAASS